MASINFNLFKSLWGMVKEKFAEESSEPLTLEHLAKLGVELKQADWDKIEARFAQDVPSKDINLSESAYKALYKYLGIQNLADLDSVVEEIERNAKTKPAKDSNDDALSLSETGFLGREAELIRLNTFLLAPEKRIMEVYGVPMIGKTALIRHFLDHDEIAKSYKHILVKLNPPPEDAERKIIDVIFENRDFEDFSGFSSNTLIVIQNFEETLKWTGNPRELHDIEDKYAGIKSLLKEITTVRTIKLIIESRFQINFWSFLTRVAELVEILKIEGVNREEFWRFYRSKGFSYEWFLRLCTIFNDHTGLLALAYNNSFIYGRDLIDAVYRPKDATRYLWECVQEIVRRLEDHEIFILCTLTFLKEPIRLEHLYDILMSPAMFHDRLEIDDSLQSLVKKMLVQTKQDYYELNPYIREVCFTFLRDTRQREMQLISNLPYLKTHGEKPVYNRFRQAQELGDYGYLIQEGKRLRQSRKYDEAFEAIEAGLQINPRPEYVLNEKAICYRETGDINKAIEIWNVLRTEYKHPPAFNELAIYYRESGKTEKAIEILEEAERISPEDVKTLTELAICYSDNKEYDKSIKVAQKAISLKHYRCYTVLANTYQRKGDLQRAYEIAQEGVKATNGRDDTLNEQLRELEKLRKPLKVFFSYSHRDEDIKERIDVFLATLKRERKVEIWSDRKIFSGEQWDEKIRLELESADIILLLISQDFINSEYIWVNEMSRALERHNRNEVVVIPIFCRATDDFRKMPFAKLNGLPVNAVPIGSPGNDNALAEVAKGIRITAEALLERRGY